MALKLSLTDVIQRSLVNIEDVRPLIKYLGMNEKLLTSTHGREREIAQEIAKQLRKMGSNDIATLFRGGDGIPYEEVVLDVGNKLKANVNKSNSIEKNEEAILLKMFEDALERMTDEEKKAVFRSMGVSEKDIPVGAISAIAIQTFLRTFGGFYIYQISVVVANMVSRAILGTGLSFATNAAITRSVGMLLGPIGWIATGLWMVIDLSGPAFRKTIPAIIHISLLRNILTTKITIGVVGSGSSGKDSLMKAVFGIESNIDPIAGSTDSAMTYPLNKRGNATIVNYPGFNDYRESVDVHTKDYLHHTDVFIFVLDISRGISSVDIENLNIIRKFKKPILICLNKIDLPRNKDDLNRLEAAAKERLESFDIIKTDFDPVLRQLKNKIGCEEVYDWVKSEIEKAGKIVDDSYFTPFK